MTLASLDSTIHQHIAEPPFDLLARARFRVTINTDNRLISDTSMSREMQRLLKAFGHSWKLVSHRSPRTSLANSRSTRRSSASAARPAEVAW